MLFLTPLPAMASWTVQLGPTLPRKMHVVNAKRHTTLHLSEPGRREGLGGAWEDVLDYLTNMGGYTGFTEEELKSGQAQLNEKDMKDFGRPSEVNNDVTTAFVLALIAFPSLVGFIGIKIFGAPAIFTFPTN